MKIGEAFRVGIIPTNDCNYCCDGCKVSIPKYYMDSDIEYRIIKFFDKTVHSCKSIYLQWFGGEPLLCKNKIIRMSHMIQETCNINNISMYSVMITNGYLLDVETMNELIQCNVFEYKIYINNNTKRHHLCDLNAQQKIINNLLAIKNEISSNLFKINIYINLTPHIEGTMKDFILDMYNNFGEDERFAITFRCVSDGCGERVDTTQLMKEETDNYNKSMYHNISSFMCNDFMNDNNDIIIDYRGEVHGGTSMVDKAGEREADGLEHILLQMK